LNPALPDDDFDAAVVIAPAHFDQHIQMFWSGLEYNRSTRRQLE